MTKSDEGYRLVLFDPPEDPGAVRDLLCKTTDIHPTDAMRWVAKTPGIWPRPISEPQARALLDGLFELGVPAEAHRADLLPNLSPPRTIHDAACLPEGFRTKGLRGEPTHWIPWDKIELIAAGRVEAEDEFRNVVPPTWVSAVSTGLNALLGRSQTLARRQRAMRISREPVGELILIRRDPRIAIRVIENQMTYAYLGDRLRATAAENFPLLVADLRDRSPFAFVTESTLGLLSHDDRGTYLFATSQSLLDYATHRLLWSWYRRDRDASQGTQS